MAAMRKKNRDWFEDWADEYDATLGKVKRHHRMLDLVVRLSEVKKGDSILDIGCGTGLLSLKFLKRKACRITAIDSSERMIELFNEKIATLQLADSIHTGLMAAEKIRFPPGSFDIAAATVALHHVDNKEPVLRKIHTLLKSGGRLLIGEIDMDTTGRHDDPKRMLRIIDYLKAEFALALREGGIAAFERMYDNGKKHLLNQGEHCITLKQWAGLSRRAGFKKTVIVPVKAFEWFKVLVATK